MRRPWKAALVGAGLALAAGASRAEEHHCQHQALGEIPAAVEHGQIITRGEVDGKPVRLIVDTGAFGTLLFESEARKLGLALRHTDAIGMGIGGQTSIFSTRVTTFSLGGVTEHNQDLVVTGRSPGATGVVGAKFLLQADVEFDIAHGSIRFFKPHGCEGDEVVYWGQAYAVTPLIPTPDDRIVVHVQINGRPIVAQMDSGAGASVLTRDAAASVGVAPSSAGVVQEDLTHGMGAAAVETFAGKFDSFSFGDETIRNPVLRIADLYWVGRELGSADLIPRRTQNEIQMLLGADFFRSHRLFFALDQHKVYASYAGGPVFYPVRRKGEEDKAPAKP